MDNCHLKNAKLGPKYQKVQGPSENSDVTSRKTIQARMLYSQSKVGSSASQVTAVEVLDVISRLPDCAEQAADAVCAYTQVRMEDAPKWIKNPKSECPFTYTCLYGYVFHDISGQSHGQTLRIPWFLLSEICTDTHLRASCGKDSLRKFFFGTRMGKSPELGVSLFVQKKTIILSARVPNLRVCQQL